jgi:hypothetical protein
VRPRRSARLGSPSLRHRAARVARRDDGEGGETLVEILVTLMLMSVAIIALLTAMLTLIASSSGHRRRIRAENEATTIVEAIDRQTYVPCSSSPATAYATALAGVPSGYTAEIRQIRFLQSKTATASYGTGCPGAGDQGAQEITVRVASPGKYDVHADVVLVKRNDTCPASPPPGLQIAVGDRC